LLLLAALISCSRQREVTPQVAYENANRMFIGGELEKSKTEARRRADEFQYSNPDWAWKFRILEAKAALWQGLFRDVLSVLQPPPPTSKPDLAIPTLTLLGVAHAHLQQYSDADRNLIQATGLCATYPDSACGDVLQARGLLASEQGNSTSAEELYDLTLSFARVHHDRFLESTAFLNLGAESLAQARFDDSIERSKNALQAANAAGARIVEALAGGNIGWASYRLGDSDRALELFLDAVKSVSAPQDFVDQGVFLTDAGYLYMDAHSLSLAEQSFQHALELEKQADSRENIYNALRALARLELQIGNPEKASEYAGYALNIARESHNHADELYPLLVQGQVAAAHSIDSKARGIFETVEYDKDCPAFLRWEAQHSLARLDDPKQPEKADREYRAALSTFESARSTVQSEDFQLSFLTNAAHIYDDYVHFLVAQGKPEEALRWADYSRARTLSEGLLSKGATNASGAPTLNAREISRRAKGVLLFYWLGEKQSYLWAITPQKTTLFPLPPGADIEAMVQRYRTALKGPQDVLEFSEDGRALYRTLIAPAQSVLGKDAKVFIIPDGSLNSLNFETLIVADPKLADPKPHFWIDDAIVTNASSLRVLNASFAARNPNVHSREIKQPRRLLLIGDNVSPSKEFAELPQAGQQMANVAKHFPANQEQIFQRAQATPSAYLNSNPENFSHIHFVAHGTASRLSPLDSAIVLSKGASETDSFKLYARDIVPHHLRAELVTISSCNSAGERAYTGEGLVGLAWAFLRAGAHNVIAGLWEVSDAPTEQLMDRFYDELDKEAGPDVALRAAKLSLLHHSQYRNPFYWAPFQLYTGS
jgi:CHAT domain-containing protein